MSEEKNTPITTDEKGLTLPKATASIMDALRKEGGHVMVAGTCVRDSLLGEKPTIWDIYSNLSQEKMATFLDAGEVSEDGIIIRIKETEKQPGQWLRIHSLDKPFPEFLLAKDFTLNAIGYDPKFGFIDPVDGLADLTTGLIRTTREPLHKFRTNPGAMFEAITLAANHGFELEKETLAAIRLTARGTVNIPIYERQEYMDGLAQLLNTEEAAKALELLISTELITGVTGNLSFLQELTLGRRMDHLKAKINETDAEGMVRLGLFYLAMGKDQGTQAVKHLPYDKDTKDRLMDVLTRMESLVVLPDKAAFKDFLGEIGRGRYEYLENMASWRGFLLGEDVPNQKQRNRYYEELEEVKEPIFRSDLAIGLGDLRTIGIEGEEAEALIKKLLHEVHRHPEKNTKEELLALAPKKRKTGLMERLGLSKYLES